MCAPSTSGEVNKRKRPAVSADVPDARPLLEKQTKKRRWVEKKSPPRKWTAVEDAALTESVKNHGAKNWKVIADFVPNRNHTQCLQRWAKVLAPGIRKGPWTSDEDQKLVECIQDLESGGVVSNWQAVADRVEGRTTKQCRERWFNHLDPRIRRGNFTDEEDTIILENQQRIGNRWSAIASMLPGRTEDAVKIRWKALTRNKSPDPVKKQIQKENKRPQKINLLTEQLQIESKSKSRCKSLGRLFESTPLSPLPISDLHEILRPPCPSLTTPPDLLLDFDLCSGIEPLGMESSLLFHTAMPVLDELDTTWLDSALLGAQEEMMVVDISCY